MAGEKWVFTPEQLANTPSRQNGIEADKETYYKQQAANFIQEMGQRLTVTQLVINTAIVYLHRFYMFQSFSKFHRNNLAQACLFLAAKVEEQPRKLEHVIKVFHSTVHKDQAALDTKSVAYLEQAQELVVNENILLQTLGFEFQVDHPHAHIVKTCNLIRAPKDLTQTSYFLATNSLHLTQMSLCYKPTFVACVCIHLACKWAQFEIPRSNEGKEWWFYVDKDMTAEILEELTQNFLSILDKCPSKFKKKLMSKSAKDEDLLSMLQAVECKRPRSEATSTATAASSATLSSSVSTSTPSRDSRIRLQIGDDSPPTKVAKIVSPNMTAHPPPGGVMRKIKTEPSISLTARQYFDKREREHLDRERQKLHDDREVTTKEAAAMESLSQRKGSVVHGDKSRDNIAQARQHTNIFDEMTKDRQKTEPSFDLTDHNTPARAKHYKAKYHQREPNEKIPFSPELQKEQRKSGTHKPHRDQRPERTDQRIDQRPERPDPRFDQRLEQRKERPDQHPEPPDQRTERPDQRPERPDQKTERPDQRAERPDQRPKERPDQRTERPDQRPNPPDQRPERPDQKPERPDQRTERPDQRPERPDQRPERPDQRPERPDQRPERPDQRPERPDQRPEHPDQRSVCPDQRPERHDVALERTDQRKDKPNLQLDQRPEKPNHKSEPRQERPERPNQKPDHRSQRPERPNQKPDQHLDQRKERQDQRKEKPDHRKEKVDPRSDQRPERIEPVIGQQQLDQQSDQKPHKSDQQLDRLEQRLERADNRPNQRLDQRPEVIEQLNQKPDLPDKRLDRSESGRHKSRSSHEHKHPESRPHHPPGKEQPRDEPGKPRVSELKIKLPKREYSRTVLEDSPGVSDIMETVEKVVEKNMRIHNVDASNRKQKKHDSIVLVEDKVDPEEGEILDDEESPPAVDSLAKDEKRAPRDADRAHHRHHHRERRVSGRYHSPAAASHNTQEAAPPESRSRHRSPRSTHTPKEETNQQHAASRERRHSGPRYDLIPAPEVTVKLTDLESLHSKVVDEIPLLKKGTPEPGEIIEHSSHKHHHKSHSKHKKDKHRDRDSSTHQSGSLKIKLDLKAMGKAATPSKHSSPVVSGSGDERNREIKLKIKSPVMAASADSQESNRTPTGLKMKLKVPASSTTTTGNGETLRHEPKEISKGSSDAKSAGSNALRLTLSKDSLSGQFTAHGSSHKSHRHSSSGEKGASSRKRPFSPSEAALQQQAHYSKLARNDSGSNLLSRRSLNDLPGSVTASSSGTSSPIVSGGASLNPALFMATQQNLVELIKQTEEQIMKQKVGKKPLHSNELTNSPHALPHS